MSFSVSCPWTRRMFSVFCYCNRAAMDVSVHTPGTNEPRFLGVLHPGWTCQLIWYRHLQLYNLTHGIFQSAIRSSFTLPTGVRKNSFVLHLFGMVWFIHFCLFGGYKMMSRFEFAGWTFFPHYCTLSFTLLWNTYLWLSSRFLLVVSQRNSW